MGSCHNCELNRRSDAGEDATFVARTATGYVRVHANQWYRGYTFFVADECVAELHELAPDVRATHLEEMVQVSAAIWDAFAPRKLNYEALGNSVPHLHWHLVPRHADDPRFWAPIWENLDYLRSVWTEQRSSQEEIDEVRAALLDALRNRSLTLRSTYDAAGTPST